MSFAQKLKYHRRRNRLYTYELANLAGLSPSVVSKLQTGAYQPTDDHITRLASALGIPREVLA